VKVGRFIQVVGVIASAASEFTSIILRDLKWRLFASFMMRRMERHAIGKHGGIPIVNLTPKEKWSEAFVPRTVEALELVERLDPVRFGRMQRQLKYILCDQWASNTMGRYEVRSGICRVNFPWFNFEKYPTGAPYIYAAVLVHEATHGAIANGEIPLPDVRRGEIERFCDSEAAGFLRHFRPEVADLWMKKFHDPARALGSAAEPLRKNLSKANPQSGANGRQPFRSARAQKSATAASRRSL
jgi:hypothetical protein